MEQDIKERTARRKAAEMETLKLKDLGNEEFKAGNYQKAVDLYVEVINY